MLFQNWRSDAKPTFKANPLIVPLDAINCPAHLRDAVRAECISHYRKAMQLMEYSVADVSQQYITRSVGVEGHTAFEDKFRADASMQTVETPGVLLHFANTYSQRYLDLMEAYIAWEIKEQIPMIPSVSGQMKTHGFTSEDILKMQRGCYQYGIILTNIRQTVGEENLAKLIEVMVGLDKTISRDEFIQNEAKRNEFLATFPVMLNQAKIDTLIEAFRKYGRLPERDLIDKAHYLMRDYGRMEYQDIATQLYYVGRMLPVFDASPEDRLVMEVRHRVSGDLTNEQRSFGSVGSYPLAYLNVVRRGEPGDPKSEFFERMYFAYMCNHFANAIIREPKLQERLTFINEWLAKNNKGWQIDPQFVEAMLKRGPAHMPPIFRYGANAALNKLLRDFKSNDDMKQYIKDHPNITLKQMMEGTAPLNELFRVMLSKRALFNQTGELDYTKLTEEAKSRPLSFYSGATAFNLLDIQDDMSEPAKEYLEVVSDLHLPVRSGISGTLDQSAAMAGLVGLCVDQDEKKRKLELETVRLAYLAFMLPGHDHSVHEIMQSGTTYGMAYEAGPGYEAYLYPCDEAFMRQAIKEAQTSRDVREPGYYFSEEFGRLTLAKLEQAPAVLPQYAHATTSQPPQPSPAPSLEPKKEDASKLKK